jgi:glycosyltransferase involved in cell wall biosynthesis
VNAQNPACPVRVLVVAHQASESSGGAGALPLRLFGGLLARGVDAWLVTHDSARAELAALLSAPEFRRVTFVGSLPGFAPVFRLGEHLPPALRALAWGITQMERQFAMVRVVRRLVDDQSIDVVHQPLSVSPVTPSPLTRLGAPVVMGPLVGGMKLPPAFRDRDSVLAALIKKARPAVARALNLTIRGRLEADVLLVADERSRALLPREARRRALTATAIGVELGAWPVPSSLPHPGDDTRPGRPIRFLFLGRLVRMKCVDILLESFAQVADRVPARMDVIGDGPEHARLTAQARRLGCADLVTFHGWLDPAECSRRMQACDVFVSASLEESGGIAVLEAMATARPVIATAWGGHLETVDHTAGILVDVSSRAALTEGLASAMVRLATDPSLRSQLGAGGRRRVEECYDWEKLTDQRLRIYQELLAGTARRGEPSAGSR